MEYQSHLQEGLLINGYTATMHQRHQSHLHRLIPKTRIEIALNIQPNRNQQEQRQHPIFTSTLLPSALGPTKIWTCVNRITQPNNQLPKKRHPIYVLNF